MISLGPVDLILISAACFVAMTGLLLVGLLGISGRGSRAENARADVDVRRAERDELATVHTLHPRGRFVDVSVPEPLQDPGDDTA